MDKEKILKAGQIAREVKAYIKPLIKKDIPLLEIAQKIEKKVEELGGKMAFPTNTSINEIAAHYTPTHNDQTLAHGLLKIDFGVHIEGSISDTAFSIDLENSLENKRIIEAAENALKAATKKISPGVKTSEIGKVISNEITKMNLNPVVNLSGHEIDEYDLHAGKTIPNIDDNRASIVEPGLYAIEPFATNGSGKVKDGPPSDIYALQSASQIRNPKAREILNFITEEYQTLPFAARWVIEKFGPTARISLRQLEQNGNLHNFPQLVEVSKGIVAQAENTFLVEDKVTVTT